MLRLWHRLQAEYFLHLEQRLGVKPLARHDADQIVIFMRYFWRRSDILSACPTIGAADFHGLRPGILSSPQTAAICRTF
jgi:hypothetical protein